MRQCVPPTLSEIPTDGATRDWVKTTGGGAPHPKSTPFPSQFPQCVTVPLGHDLLCHLQQAFQVDVNKLTVKFIRKAKGTKTAMISKRSPWTDGPEHGQRGRWVISQQVR